MLSLKVIVGLLGGILFPIAVKIVHLANTLGHRSQLKLTETSTFIELYTLYLHEFLIHKVCFQSTPQSRGIDGLRLSLWVNSTKHCVTAYNLKSILNFP